MKYTQEVKDNAVKAAKEGTSLKVIQNTIGPNPKAVMRYLAKEGIIYKDLKEELKEKGILKGTTKNQKEEKAKKAEAAKLAKETGKAVPPSKPNSKAPVTTMIEE